MSNAILPIDTVAASGAPGPHTRWLDVTVASLETGDPFRLTFYFVLTLPTGALKHISKSVPVTDAALQERLRREARPGDAIRVCLETRWEDDAIPTILKDFCRP